MLLLLYDGSDLGDSHGHTAFPVRLTRLFAHVLCNSPYGLKQTQNMSGSVLLTTEASQLSVGIAEVAYYIELLSPTALENLYPSGFPTIMKSFFLGYGDETPGSVEPSGEHDSCFGGGSLECPAQGNLQ